MTSHSELFVEAEAERAAGNAAAAEGLYRRLLARLPHHVKALRALGDVLRQQGKADEAASTLAAADRIDTENLARVAEGLLGLGHLQKAERSIKRALKVDPNHGEALWVLGQIHRSKGDFSSAIDAYGRIPASDPRHAPAAYVRAILAGNTVWQAPSDSQPRPAPFVVIEDFLPQDSHDALLEFTFAQRGEFQLSVVGSGDYKPERRSSLVIVNPEEAKEWFLPRLEGVLPKVLPRLHMDDVDKGHIELQITAHHDGDFYKPHIDIGEEGEESFTRRLSFVYYYYRTPRRFTGGDLLLYDTLLPGEGFVQGGFSRIEARDNDIVFFPSQYSHEIEQVRCESKDFQDGRFTLNGWIHSERTDDS